MLRRTFPSRFFATNTRILFASSQQQKREGILSSISLWLQQKEHNRTMKLHENLIGHGHSCVHLDASVFPAQLSYCGSFYGGCKFQTHILKRCLYRFPYIILFSLLCYLGFFLVLFSVLFLMIAWMSFKHRVFGWEDEATKKHLDDERQKWLDENEPPLTEETIEEWKKAAEEYRQKLANTTNDKENKEEGSNNNNQIVEKISVDSDTNKVVIKRKRNDDDKEEEEEVKKVSLMEFAKIIAKDMKEIKKLEEETKEKK